jgi:hypothetical protein
LIVDGGERREQGRERRLRIAIAQKARSSTAGDDVDASATTIQIVEPYCRSTEDFECHSRGSSSSEGRRKAVSFRMRDHHIRKTGYLLPTEG